MLQPSTHSSHNTGNNLSSLNQYKPGTSKESHKRQNLTFADGENSIDNDISTFNDIDRMKEYTDNIWKRTLATSSGNPVWHSSELSHQAPSIVWPSNSTSSIFNTPKSSKPPLRQSGYNENLWKNVVGTNVFFPTSPTSGMPGTTSGLPMSTGVRRYSGDSPKKGNDEHYYRQKLQNRKKYGRSQSGDKASNSTNSDLDTESYNNCKTQLSLNALRNKLFRQKGVENLNNDEMARLAGNEQPDGQGEDFIQVCFLVFIISFQCNIAIFITTFKFYY